MRGVLCLRQGCSKPKDDEHTFTRFVNSFLSFPLYFALVSLGFSLVSFQRPSLCPGATCVNCQDVTQLEAQCEDPEPLSLSCNMGFGTLNLCKHFPESGSVAKKGPRPLKDCSDTCEGCVIEILFEVQLL